MKRKIIYILSIFSICIIFHSCGIYSFTGVDISPEVKTVTIDYFPNRASLVQPNLSNVFTEALKDKFTSQTNLNLVNFNGDLHFEGEITGYNVTAQAYQGDETAALNRLSITIRVKYTNNIEPNKSFDTSFTQYADFDSSQSLTSVEAGLIEEISGLLVADIFNKSVANW